MRTQEHLGSGVEINFQTGSVRLNLGHAVVPLTPNFASQGFRRLTGMPSLLQISNMMLENINENLWREFDIECYRRVRPLLPIPYLEELGDLPPVVIVDEEPIVFHTREPFAMGFTDFRSVLTKTNLLPVLVSAKSLKLGGKSLRELSRLPRLRPLIMVLDEEDTLPLHGQYLKTLVRPEEMTRLHELSLLKFWAKTVYETINFGDISELCAVVRLEGSHYASKWGGYKPKVGGLVSPEDFLKP
jgi:hypothetical protein